LEEEYKNQQIIIGVDRLSRFSGIEHKLKAFDEFCRLYGKSNVILYQIIYLSNECEFETE
jgi:trehalose-6-phosphate synthase